MKWMISVRDFMWGNMPWANQPISLASAWIHSLPLGMIFLKWECSRDVPVLLGLYMMALVVQKASGGSSVVSMRMDDVAEWQAVSKKKE
jgi:hypothetical protein